MMLKSTFDKVTSDAGLVTPASVGCKVTVANANNEVATFGILRFVGELEGQDGIFCGVELAEALGKNDGSYKGIQFFSCQPNHGLFLPIHRVKLSQKRQQQSNQMQRPDRLVHSMIPNVPDYGSYPHSLDVSMMSTNSSSWLSSTDEDLDMFNSNITYNVTRPSYLLQEIEEPRPLISMDDYMYEEPTNDAEGIFNNNMGGDILATSYVVHDSRMDKSRLPVIGSPVPDDEEEDEEEDLETPIVENRSLNSTLTEKNADQQIENRVDSENNREAKSKPSPSTKKIKTASGDVLKKNKNGNSNTSISEKKEKKRLTLKEMIEAQPPPVQREAKPKKVSKQQQVMEQILQKMKEQNENGKEQAAAKASRKRLSELWNQPPPPPKPAEGMTQHPGQDDKKKVPLKVLNHPPAKPRNPPKPRQSLLPPKVAPTAVENAKIAHPEVKFRAGATTTRTTPGFKYMSDTKAGDKDKKLEDGAKNKRSSAVTTGRPLSQFSTASSKSSIASRAPAKQPSRRPTVKACTPFEKKLIGRYKGMRRLTTVLGLVSGNLAGQYDAILFKRNLDQDSITAKTHEIEHLNLTIKNLEESYKDQISTLKEQHHEELNKLKTSKEIEHQQSLKALQQTHQEDLDERDVNYLHVENQLKEANAKISELRKTLNEGTDSKIQILNLEIKSLQDMLDIKNQEATELLKSKNREVVLREKFYQLEKDHKALKCEYEQESFKFKMNRDVIRTLREDCNKKDIKVDELILKQDKLEKRMVLYQQRVDELEAINNSAGENSVFIEHEHDDTQYDSEYEEKPSSSDTDNEAIAHHNLLNTYQKTGRKLLSMNGSAHQDVICLPEGRFTEDNEEEDEEQDQGQGQGHQVHRAILADTDTF